MPWWMDYAIFGGAMTVSLFDTVTLLWLGLTVFLTGDRRKPATIAGSAGLLLGAIFFGGHTLIITHTFGFGSTGVNLVWRIMWVVAVAAPFFWGLAIYYYSGDPATGRWVRAILTVAAMILVLLLFVISPLPSFNELLLSPALPASIAWAYVAYLFLCFMLPLIALRRQRNLRGQRDPFHRARPWLLAAASMFALAFVAFAFVTYAIIPRALPIYTLTEQISRALYVTDGVIAGFIALAIIFLGRAVLSNTVLTERPPTGQGFFARWRSVVLVSAAGALLVSFLYVAPIRPIYSLILTAGLAAAAYALFNWRQYEEHEEFMRRLDPFVTSLHLHEHLLASGADSEIESRDLFTALCRDALRADHACLLFDVSIGGRQPPDQRIDYRWRPEYDTILRAALTRLTGWSRLDGDHWGYPLSDSRGAIGRLILGPKLNGSEYNVQELQVASACAERILDALAGEQLARVAVNLLQQRIAQVQVLSAQHKRILHDEVLPQIHLALLKVESLRSAGRDSNSPSDGAQQTDEATTALMQAHRRISALVREMSNAVPTRLESEGLAAAMQSALAHDFRDSFDRIDWQAEPVAIDQAKRLPLFASEVIFYAAQEALRNAAKHGRGDDARRPLHLEVALHSRSGLELIVEDDGVGRPIDQPHDETGSGLRFHTAMLAVIGGTLSVEDRSGGGTRVVIAVSQP